MATSLYFAMLALGLAAGFSHCVALMEQGTTLAITHNEQEIFLLWPTNALGFAAQFSVNPGVQDSWTTITSAPVTVGSHYRVTTGKSSEGAVFYRLAK